MIIGKACFALAWLVWLLTRPAHWTDVGGLWAERRLTMAGVKAKMRAPGVARP